MQGILKESDGAIKETQGQGELAEQRGRPIKMTYFYLPRTLSVICPQGSTIFPSLLTGDDE